MLKHINLLRSGYSYLKSNISGNASISGMPVSLGIELTNNCNLNCPECTSGSGALTRKRGYMEMDLFEKIINETGSYLYNINLYFQGESMLHPQLFSFLGKITHIHTVLSTNGHFLSWENSEELVKSGLNQLIVSLDGMDQDTYSEYRKKGNIDTVRRGIKNVADAKKKFRSQIELEIQFLVNRFNEKQIPEIIRYASELKVSLKLKSMQIINKENIIHWLPLEAKYGRYRQKDRDYEIKSPLHNKCMRLWFNPVVTWDGKVLPCCFDKDAEHVMGDLNLESFREIWNGPKYKIFRERVLSGRRMIEICRNCTSGLKGVRY